MSDNPKNTGSIPEWQKVTDSTDPQPSPKEKPARQDDNDLLTIARQWLSDASIKDKPREDKVEFLKTKELSPEQIDELLKEDQKIENSELRTIHDTSERTSDSNNGSKISTETTSTPSAHDTRLVEQRPEVAPIVTYPEFLLKPQKPPPLITVPRLVNAAYAIAGVAGLTWAASKYILDPMLETLTEARREFADTTLQDLQKLNVKLESTVSHVPYFASSATKRHQQQEEEIESLDEDPTELFHRDVATQTTPGLSRSSSTDSLNKKQLDPTITQANRLSNLTYSVRSLLQSIEHSSDNEQHLQKTVEDFQKKLDQLESSYSTLTGDYYGSSNMYSSATNEMKKSAGSRDDEAQRFKQEIRSLKGAFLSSRNFPTAPRPTSTGGSYGAR